MEFWRVGFRIEKVADAEPWNGSISSLTHWPVDKSSSSILNLFFFNVDFQCPLRCLHSRRAFLASGNMFSHGDVFWERIPSFPSRNSSNDFCYSVRNVLRSIIPLPIGITHFRPLMSLSSRLCSRRPLRLSRLILEKTLACSGLPDTLRERPVLRPLRCSPLTFDVLDSECCDTSCTFEFLLEHPSKAVSDASEARFGVFQDLLIPLPQAVLVTAGVGEVGLSSVWPEWDPSSEMFLGFSDVILNSGGLFFDAEAQFLLWLLVSAIRGTQYIAAFPKILAMSGPAELNPTSPTSAVRNTMGKGNEQISKNPNEPASDTALREYCDKHYHQLLPLIPEKVHTNSLRKLEGARGVTTLRVLNTKCKRRTPKGAERTGLHPRSVSGIVLSQRVRSFPDIRRDRVWFNDLPSKSIDSYDDLKKAFLANFLQQKKYIKDRRNPPHQAKGRRIHERFCTKSGGAKWMRVTTAFLKGRSGSLPTRHERKALPTWKETAGTWRKRTSTARDEDFQNQQRSERRRDKFTLLTKSPREILALDKGNFKSPPPMTTHRCVKQGGQKKRISQRRAHKKKGRTSRKDKAIRDSDGPTVAEGKNKGPLHTPHVCGWGNHPWEIQSRAIVSKGSGENIAASENRGSKTFDFRMDELCGSKVTISVQQNHREAKCEENSSSPINGLRNVEIPGPKRSTYSTEQQNNPAGMRDGLQTGSTVPQYRSGHGKKNQSGHPS
ncbi:hypothetical protein Tco_0666878 [Tanacetum coccineum]